MLKVGNAKWKTDVIDPSNGNALMRQKGELSNVECEYVSRFNWVECRGFDLLLIQ